MPSKWFYPSHITQYAEASNHIPWLGTDASPVNIRQIRTKTDLTTIANDLQFNNMRTTTNYLVMTGFHINHRDVPNILNGLELYVSLQRHGRITDDTVMFTYQGNNVSNNRANPDLSNVKTYGGETDLWDMDPIVYPLITSPNFGILLRFQSNIFLPHKTTPNMEHVQLRLW